MLGIEEPTLTGALSANVYPFHLDNSNDKKKAKNIEAKRSTNEQSIMSAAKTNIDEKQTRRSST